MKKMVSIWLLLHLGMCVAAQESKDLWSSVFKIQKQYITSSIDEKVRSKYFSLLYFSTVIHPKVNAEIKKLNASFWDEQESLNVLEYFPNYTSVNGWIWKSNTTSCYTYTYGPDKKLLVQEKLVTQLNDSAKDIIQNFGNWSHPVFSINGQALGNPTDHPFFWASKYSPDVVQTIGFYYQ